MKNLIENLINTYTWVQNILLQGLSAWSGDISALGGALESHIGQALQAAAIPLVIIAVLWAALTKLDFSSGLWTLFLVVVGATAALAALPLASPFLLVFVAFVALAIMRSWRRGAMIALIVTGTMLLVGGQAIVFVPVLILALPLLWWRSGFWTTAALGVMAYWAIKLFGSAWQLPILLVLAFSTFCWLGLPKPAAAKK